MTEIDIADPAWIGALPDVEILINAAAAATLDAFFGSLLAAEQKKWIARITYFGDSIVATDFVTGDQGTALYAVHGIDGRVAACGKQAFQKAVDARHANEHPGLGAGAVAGIVIGTAAALTAVSTASYLGYRAFKKD